MGCSACSFQQGRSISFSIPPLIVTVLSRRHAEHNYPRPLFFMVNGLTSMACNPPPRALPALCVGSAKLIFGDPLIVLLIFGGMVRFMAGYAIGSYLPDFFSQIYPDDNTICE